MIINNLSSHQQQDENKQNQKQESQKQKKQYDYFNSKVNKSTIDSLIRNEKDERYLYFLKYGVLRRYEGEGDVLFVEIPQIQKKIVIYRKPAYRVKSFDKLYLNNIDLPHIPLFEGEENLKLLSLEGNSISKIDHLVSLNSLLYLNLYNNKINDIENLQSIPKLKALMLGKNNIEKIKNLNILSDLEVLDLHSNKIKQIENLTQLKKLRLLNLANNLIASFSELFFNLNLEEVNLRKNLIVNVPNLSGGVFEKVRKLNIGKNLISKVEFLYEFKKMKSLNELLLEENPVLIIKESCSVLKLLPLKGNSFGLSHCLNLEQQQSGSNVLSQWNTEGMVKCEKNYEKLDNQSQSQVSKIVSKSKRKLSDKLSKSNLCIKEKDQIELTKSKVISLSNTNITNITSTNPNPTSSQPTKLSFNEILTHIKKEWEEEKEYIQINGYDGYNIKRLKETKVFSGHAELEDNTKLRIYGNAMRIISEKEFFNKVEALSISFFNIDLILNKKILEKLKKYVKLRSISLSNNNIHSFFQLIKFEETSPIEVMSITENEVCKSNMLKHFLTYRFQFLKELNGIEITSSDRLDSKKVFEGFDNYISRNECILEKEGLFQKENHMAMSKEKENNDEKFEEKILEEYNQSMMRMELFDFVVEKFDDVMNEIFK